ncbi:speckle-type POZ protein [Caerostris extrusa]|uniref:Speckle-type POZ protein n=1 Tax=Caerostris extrusa TaxID=172846 RepID=A0AAV4Y903_CAEEX|nr:speckle-type POZ protein [Caerostris extrusa]
MASQVNDFTVTWRIENYHLRFHRPDYYLDSVEYLMDTMEQTKWKLRLDPCHSKDKASLCFRRSREDDGPDALSLDYEFSFIQSDGKEEKSLSPVVLTVRCRIWKSDGSATETGRGFIRTRLKEDNTAFLAFVEKFSTAVTSRSRAVLKIRSASLAKPSMSLNLSLKEGVGCQDSILLGIVPSEPGAFFYCKCQLFVVEATGLKTECGVYEKFPIDFETIIGWKIQLPLTKAHLMQRRTAFLPGDVLTFQCEFTFSTGIEFERVEKTEFGKSVVTERGRSHFSHLSGKTSCPCKGRGPVRHEVEDIHRSVPSPHRRPERSLARLQSHVFERHEEKNRTTAWTSRTWKQTPCADCCSMCTRTPWST